LHRKHHPALDAGTNRNRLSGDQIPAPLRPGDQEVAGLFMALRLDRGVGAKRKLGAIFSGSSSKSR